LEVWKTTFQPSSYPIFQAIQAERKGSYK